MSIPEPPIRKKFAEKLERKYSDSFAGTGK
jgi:hypothetical protein